MTNAQLKEMAKKLYTDEALQRKWLLSVKQLGGKWLLANPVQRKTPLKEPV